MTVSMHSVPTVFKAWYARIARSRMTIAFFIFVLAYCAAQTTLHATVSLCYARNHDLVSSAIDAAGVRRGFTIFRDGVLEKCLGIPTAHRTTCYIVYNGSTNARPALESTQDMQCAEGLTWLETYLRDSGSEEVVYLALQCWLLMISLLVLADESIPNLIVVLAAQVVDTGWISYRIASDTSAKRIYNEIIVDGTCGGRDILKGLWKNYPFQLALGFSIAALLAMSFFVFKLVKLYSEGTLCTVGSSSVIDRSLRSRLWMRVFLQFTTFFTLSSAAMWYDKRKAGIIAPYSVNTLHDTGFYVVGVILFPWLVLGIYSISRENHFQFLVYVLLSIALLVISALWFESALFRYEYKTWHSFTCVTTMADALLVITCILSIICRLNFGRGLAHFLVVDKALRVSGFPCDLFQHGSTDPCMDVERRTIIRNHHGLGTCLAVNISCASLETSEIPTFLASAETPVFATWLASQGGGSQEKRRQDGLANIIIISTENNGLCDIQSTSDDGSISWTNPNENKRTDS